MKRQPSARTERIRNRARSILRDLASGVLPGRRSAAQIDENVTDFLASLAPEIKLCRDADVPITQIRETLREQIRIEFGERTLWRALEKAADGRKR